MKDFALWVILLGVGLATGVFIGVLLSLAISLHVPPTWLAVFTILVALAIVGYDLSKEIR